MPRKKSPKYVRPNVAVESATHLEGNLVAESGLDESAVETQFLLEAINALGEGIVIAQAGRYLYSNHAYQALTGYSSEELARLPSLVDLILEADRPSAIDWMRRRIAGQPVPLMNEFHLVTASGRVVDIEVAAKALGLPQSGRSMAVVRDVTERNENQAKFEGLLEAAPDAMVGVYGDGTIAFVNQQAEKLFGYNRTELLRHSIETLMPERFRDVHPRHRAGYFAKPKVRPMGAGLDLFGRRKDGSEFPAEILLSSMKTEDGLLVTAAVRDVSERKAMEEELRRYRSTLEEMVEERTTALTALNKELEAFSYSVSHDLRAPLRTLEAFSQMLLEDQGERLDTEGRDILDRIQKASQRMAELLDALQNLFRLTLGDIRHERVDLSALATEVVAELRAADPGRELTIETAPGLTVRADARLMRILLTNLIGNAWKFTTKEPATVIKVGSETVEGERRFFVRDNGVGFDITKAHNLFGAFQRLEDARDFPGTGIGLATVRRIVNRHGGRIWAEGAVGEGATFYFTL